MDRSIDLIHGDMKRNFTLFCLPIFYGLIFQNLYNSVDSIVVGQFVSSNALAAVTVCGNITNMMVGFFTGLSTGASVLYSRYFSADDPENLRKSIHTSILFVMLLGIAITAAALFYSRALLQFINCPADVIEDALVYLRIYLIGLLFTGFYNVGSAVMRSVGDSRTPFYYLIAASLLNIVLDVLLVTAVHMGVIGVAVATIISQGVSAFLTMRRMRTTKEVWKLEWADLKIDRPILKEIILLGMPAAIQTIIQSISNLFVQGYINEFGAYAVAGIGSAQKIDQFACMPAQSIGLGLTTYVSLNEGADEHERCRRGIQFATVLDLIITALVSIPVYMNAGALMSIFTNDPEVIKAGIGLLRVIMPLYEFMGLMQVSAGILRGYGKSMAVMAFSIGGMVVLRQIYLFIVMNRFHTIQMIYWCYPVCWIATVAASYIYYFMLVRKRAA